MRIGPNPTPDKSGDFPDVEMYFLPVGCQHCENPECVQVCPTQASHIAEDGTVQIDKSKCIGCQFCAMACPYGVRYLNEEERVVEKCTLCEQQISQGDLPQCVAQCCGRARWFGDVEKGYETFEAPGFDVADTRDFQTVHDSRLVLGDVTGADSVHVIEPYTESDVYHLPNVGNNPSFAYILRDRTWQGKE